VVGLDHFPAEGEAVPSTQPPSGIACGCSYLTMCDLKYAQPRVTFMNCLTPSDGMHN